MKTRSPQRAQSIIRLVLLESLRLCTLTAGLTVVFSVANAQTARASSDLDRQYALENVGVLKAWDNVDGLFAEYFNSAYKDYFSKQSRFALQDLSKADAVLSNAKIPYVKLIEDPQVLAQIARSMKTQTMMRTKVYKEGSKYRVVVDWLHMPQAQLLVSDTFSLDAPANGISDFKTALHQSLDRMIAKIPFVATVTGRDEGTITVNIGANARLAPGDTLVIATLDEVKKHPLLKEIVDWRMTRTGRAVVDEVDDGMAFCKILEEDYGRQISRFQKVVQIIPAPPVPEKSVIKDAEQSREEAYREPPRLGFLAPGLMLGSSSREASTLNGTSGRTGSGLLVGVKGDAQLWLNREWFADLGLTFATTSYSQNDIQTGQPVQGDSLGTTLTQVRVNGGYMFHLTPDFFGPKGWLKAGYQTTSYRVSPATTAEQTSTSSFNGIFIGLGGDLPVRGPLGALLNIDFGLFTSGSQSGPIRRSTSGASSVNFFVGGYYRYTQRMTFRAGIDFMSQGMDFTDGGTLSHKVVSIGPSVQFFF